jgi:hypothetical protein
MNLKNLLFAYIFLLFTFPLMCLADSPARALSDYRVCSSNNGYCAQVTVADGILIYKVSQGRGEHLLRTIPGWYPQVFLSNDGEKIVTVGTTIVPEYDFSQPVVQIFIREKLGKSFLAKDLIANQKMGRTTSGLHWGDPIGFSSDELFFSFKLDKGQIATVPIQDNKMHD